MNTLFQTGYGIENNIDNSEFELFKKQTLDNLKTISVPASKLKMVKNGLEIEHNGRKRVFSFENSSSLYGIVKGGKSALKTINKSLKKGEKINTFIINEFLKKSKNSVSLTFNKEKITSASLTKSCVSAHQYFRFVEEIMNRYKLEIDQVNNGGGKINISFRTDNKVNMSDNEIFKTGFNLSWNQNIKYNPYVLRMICTNGMRFPLFKENVVMKDATKDSWNEFLKNIDIASKQMFMPSGFAKAHDRAENTIASLDEFKFTLKQLKWAIGDENAMNVTLDLKDGGQTTFGSIVNNVNTELARIGDYDFDNLDSFNLKSQRTPMNVMSLVNAMTDVGSHDYGFNNYNHENLRINGGKLFSKERFDNETKIPQIQFYNI